MIYNGLNSFISNLKQHKELVEINEPVSPELEIPEIADRCVKNNGKALLFTNNGSQFPLLINAFASDKRMKLALNNPTPEAIGNQIIDIVKLLHTDKKGWLGLIKLFPKLKHIAQWLPKVKNSKGICQQVIHHNCDLNLLPILKCWPYDGGKFITLPVVHTKDPITGIRNVGMYRMQVFNNNTTGMHWHIHKGAARHFELYKKLNRKMPVAVVLGGDPVYTYVATAPLPDGIDEYLLAGCIRKKGVEMVRCISIDMEVPADADFVIEGYIDPKEEYCIEGPFGDHTGFYSLQDLYPKFHITCITHRTDAVYPATIVGIPPQEDAFIGKITEQIFLPLIKISMLPELTDMHFPIEGVFHNLVIVKINSLYPGDAYKVVHNLLGSGQLMFSKIIIVVNEDIDIRNYWQVMNCIFKNVSIKNDLHFSKGVADILDHSGETTGIGSKMAIDATKKTEDIEKSFSNMLTEAYVQALYTEMPEIVNIETTLIEKNIPVLIVAAQKKEQQPIKKLHQKIINNFDLPNLQAIVYMDANADISNLSQVIWLCANNIAPQRDCYFESSSAFADCIVLGIDATAKSIQHDNFPKPWPNIAISDLNTINKIDQIWNKLKIGPFMPSPSLDYIQMVSNEGAVKEF